MAGVTTPPANYQGPAILTLGCVEAISRARPDSAALWALNGLFLGYNDLQEGFGGLWNARLGPAEESWVLERHDQECVDASLPPTIYLFPLPNPLISPVTTQQ